MSSSATTRLVGLALSRMAASPVVGSVAERAETTETPDDDLLVRVGAGDRDALATIFRHYAKTIRNIGRRILQDAAESDDLVQEVFLYIHRKSRLFDSSKGSARSWIIQVGYTQALLRRRQLRSHGFYLSGIPDKPSDSHHSCDDGGAHYDRSVEGLFGREVWRKIVEDLTEDQRETLRLHFFEGLTFAEIAERIGQSYANVRNHHYRGIEKLRSHLRADELNMR